MRLAIVVTEYPKTTETFILRDVMSFLEQRVDVRIFHLAPANKSEILHDFARGTLQHARQPLPYGRRALRRAVTRPGRVLGCAATIIRRQAPEPILMAKSLGIVMSACALADEIEAWGADHIHAEFAGHPATAAWVASRLTGIPYSVSCRAHDIFRTQRLLAEKLCEAAFVRTVSHYAKAFLLERVAGLDPRRMHVIHSSVPAEIIPRLGPIPADPFHILYVGSLQIRKGVDVLLKALGVLDFADWRCTIAGDGPDRRKLEDLAARLGFRDKVSFIGKQDFASVSALYASASVVAVPSVIGPKGRTEGIPNVAIEALAFQRPVISTRVSGIPELIRERRTGRLIDPGSVQQLAAAIAEIKADPDGAHEMAVAGRNVVESEFSLARNAMRQLELFRSHGALRAKEAIS